jgi:hypothetical protein
MALTTLNPLLTALEDLILFLHVVPLPESGPRLTRRISQERSLSSKPVGNASSFLGANLTAKWRPVFRGTNCRTTPKNLSFSTQAPRILPKGLTGSKLSAFSPRHLTGTHAERTSLLVASY